MINFKTLKLQQQWNSGELNPMLTLIILAMTTMMAMKYNVILVITSLFRQGDKGVHGYWRGADVRTVNLKTSEVQAIVDWVNGLLIYDPDRPKMKIAIEHDVGRGNHIHLQVYPNTCLK